MDPFTHVLLGATVSYVGWRQRLGRTAALAGGLAAFAPDADVFIRSATDPLLAIEHHRGFTHALAFAPIGAAIVAALWLIRPQWRARSRWLLVWGAALTGYITHPLLDAATSYGTQLWWPFSRHRAGWDLISIIDPLFTLTLLLGLILALRRQNAVPALLALVLAGGYVGWGGFQHSRAMHVQQQLAASRGHTFVRAEVMPTLANNIIWRALYEHDGRIYSDRIRVGWTSKPQVREGWSLPRVQANDLSETERGRDTQNSFSRFAWFSDHWVARSPKDPGMLADMRYSLSTEAFDPIWGIRFRPAAETTPVDWVNRSRDRQVNGRELWDEIRGRDPRFKSLAAE